MRRFPAPARSRIRRSERGTSLLEVVLTVSLFTMVLATLLSVADSFFSAHAKQESAIEYRSTARVGGAELARLVRTASTFDAPPGAGAARSEVTLRVPMGGGRVDRVRIRRDLPSGEIRRERLDPVTGAVLETRTLIRGVVDGGAPFVRYFDRTGIELNPGVMAMVPLVGCTMRVSFTVDVAPSATRNSNRLEIGGSPRGRRAEELLC